MAIVEMHDMRRKLLPVYYTTFSDRSTVFRGLLIWKKLFPIGLKRINDRQSLFRHPIVKEFSKSFIHVANLEQPFRCC